MEGDPQVTGYTREEVEQALAAGQIVAVFDVRRADEFAAGTALGARHTGVDGLEAAWTDLPADAMVVLVCNHGGGRSQAAAAKAREAGFGRARHLVGGAKG